MRDNVASATPVWWSIKATAWVAVGLAFLCTGVPGWSQSLEAPLKPVAFKAGDTLRGVVARRFLANLEGSDPQQIMARVTGDYKHGNERTAKNHPRSAGR